jgi:threonine/homoserine/homoserine lactone efflux protein
MGWRGLGAGGAELRLGCSSSLPVAPEILAPFLLAVLALLVAPGPDMAFVVACGVSAGRRGGVLAALGITVGVSVHVVLAALGTGMLMQAFPALAEGIRLAGAIYLAYLAVTTWRDSGSAMVGGGLEGGKGVSSVFWRGVVVNLTNPKIIVFFAAFLTQFTDPDRGSVALQLLTLGLILQGAGLVVDAAFGLAAGSVRDVFTRRPGLQALLDRVAAGVFGVLALALFVEALL